jgi:diaminopimelate decarboxylase
MAYFELSKSVLKEKYNSLKDICNIIAYNHKANPDVGKVLENETNCLLVMSSLPAISDIKDKSRIIYIIQGENQKEIETLYEQNITSFIVDNEPDLNKVLSLNKPIKLYLRMKFKEHTVYTGKYFVYGLDWQKTNDLIPSLAKNKNIIQWDYN